MMKLDENDLITPYFELNVGKSGSFGSFWECDLDLIVWIIDEFFKDE